MTSGKGYREGARTWSQLQVCTYQCNECLQISREALGRLAGMERQRPLGAGHAQLDKYLVGMPERLSKRDKSRAITQVTHRPERNSTILL